MLVIVYRILFPNISTHNIDVVQILCMGISVPVGYAFFRSLFPNEFSRWIQHYTLITAALFAFVVVGTSTLFASWSQIPYYISLNRTHRLLSGKTSGGMAARIEAAAFIFGGFVILGIAGINDMLLDAGLIRSIPVIAPGMFMFMLFPSLCAFAAPVLGFRLGGDPLPRNWNTTILASKQRLPSAVGWKKKSSKQARTNAGA